jgi:hypothetical protein
MLKTVIQTGDVTTTFCEIYDKETLVGFGIIKPGAETLPKIKLGTDKTFFVPLENGVWVDFLFSNNTSLELIEDLILTLSSVKENLIAGKLPEKNEHLETDLHPV